MQRVCEMVAMPHLPIFSELVTSFTADNMEKRNILN